MKQGTGRKKYRYINGTKGVISLFLALLMTPFLTIAGSLINAARINSAVAIFDEALCNASESTLGTYDEFLRKRFGLLAMSQDLSDKRWEVKEYTVSDLISETFSFYMDENLKALGNTYITYQSDAEGVYPLADTDILLSQVLEYSKYSVPTKIVEEAISLEDIIKTLEKNLPGSGIFDLITAGSGVADSIVTLSDSLKTLKDAITEEKTAITNYKNAYSSFSASISSYLQMEEERNTTLTQIQSDINVLQNKIETLPVEITSLEAQLASIPNTEKNKAKRTALQTEINNKKDELSKAPDDKKALEEEYVQKEEYYIGELNTLRQDVDTCKTTYSTKIRELSSKILATKGQITAAQAAINGVGSSAANMATTTVTTARDQSIKENEEKIKKLEKELETAPPEKKAEIESNITVLKDGITNLGNQKEVTNAVKEGFDDAMDSLKSLSDFNVDLYDTSSNSLLQLKMTVDAYDSNSINSEISKSEYYIEIDGLLTLEQLTRLEENLCAECTKNSIWAIVKAVFGFFEALLSMTVLYTPECGAVINKLNLPSQKDRTVHPLNNGYPKDAELSEYYKSVYGDYGNTDGNDLENFDMVAAVIAIFTDLGIIMTNVTMIGPAIIFLKFAEIFKTITDAIGRIFENAKRIVAYLGNAFSESAIGSKILLSGYVSYMTSDRTTYKEKALTGVEFNLRQQLPTTNWGNNPIGGILSLISTVKSASSGGQENCFVGAEKEYILFGNSSELVNQIGTFAIIYIVRFVFNLWAISTNAEVASMAAACTIGGFVVYAVIGLLEPFIDTVLLVNGEKVPIIKTSVYLTPSGIGKLITKVASIGLTSEKLAEVQSAFKGVTVSKGAYSDKTFFDMSYSQMLLIMLTIAPSKEKMLARLSDIIQMEAIEYQKNVDKITPTFDLDNSYTYLRTEAGFKMNEFISLSDGIGLNSKKRIIYRGY